MNISRKNVTKFFSTTSPSFRAQYLDDHSSKSNEPRIVGNYTSKTFCAYKIWRKWSSERPPNSSTKIGLEIKIRQKKRTSEVAKWEASISVYTPPPPQISEKNHEEKEWKNIEIGRKKWENFGKIPLEILF